MEPTSPGPAGPTVPAGARERLVIGLTGPNASGKGEVALIFRGLGFRYHSLSDIIREEALAAGLSTGRDQLILMGNELRRRSGPGALAERMIGHLTGLDVVDSIRNPAEVRVLRTLPRFWLLGVSAPPEVRYRRALLRGGRGDALQSLQAFLAKESEENSSNEEAQQLDATFSLADHVLLNGGSLEDLRRNLLAWLEGL